MGYTSRISKQAVFEATAHYLGEFSSGASTTYVTKYKKTVDWTTIDKLCFNVYISAGGGATAWYEIKINGVQVAEESSAGAIKNVVVDCSAITGRSLLEINVKTDNALNWAYFKNCVIYTMEG